MTEDVCIDTFCDKLAPRVRYRNTIAKAEPEFSSWWLVFMAASFVCFAIWGLGL